MNNKCKLDIPYPEIKVSSSNICYANLLQNDYAGQGGELTAILQYYYQHLIMLDKHKDISDTLECVSISEMHHLEIIGTLITLLGGDPQFRVVKNGCNSYWTGTYINPCKQIRTLLLANIESEERAIANYTMRIRQINDPLIGAIIERIIIDEEHHIKLFRECIVNL